MPYYEIIWNEESGGNVQHIAEHDLTPEDVEAVIFNPVDHDVSHASGLPLLFCLASRQTDVTSWSCTNESTR